MKEGGINMAIFMGRYFHNLDQKNRIFIPSKFRDALGESFVLYMPKKTGKCLFAYTLADWEEVSEHKNNKPLSKELTLQQRSTYLGTEMVDVDNQGRVTICKEFCEFATLEKEVVFFGAGRRIEIWSRGEWDAMLQAKAECDDDEEDNVPF